MDTLGISCGAACMSSSMSPFLLAKYRPCGPICTALEVRPTAPFLTYCDTSEFGSSRSPKMRARARQVCTQAGSSPSATRGMQ